MESHSGSLPALRVERQGGPSQLSRLSPKYAHSDRSPGQRRKIIVDIAISYSNPSCADHTVSKRHVPRRELVQKLHSGMLDLVLSEVDLSPTATDWAEAMRTCAISVHEAAG